MEERTANFVMENGNYQWTRVRMASSMSTSEEELCLIFTFHLEVWKLHFPLLIDSNINFVCLLAVRNVVNVSGLGKLRKYF